MLQYWFFQLKSWEELNLKFYNSSDSSLTSKVDSETAGKKKKCTLSYWPVVGNKLLRLTNKSIFYCIENRLAYVQWPYWSLWTDNKDYFFRVKEPQNILEKYKDCNHKMLRNWSPQTFSWFNSLQETKLDSSAGLSSRTKLKRAI